MARSRSRSRMTKNRPGGRPTPAATATNAAGAIASLPAPTSVPSTGTAGTTIPFVAASASTPRSAPPPFREVGAPPSAPLAARSSPPALPTPPETASVPGEEPLDAEGHVEPASPGDNAEHPWDEWTRQACRAKEFNALEGVLLTMELAEETTDPPPRGTSARVRHFAQRRLEWCMEKQQAPDSWLLNLLYDLHPVSDRLDEEHVYKTLLTSGEVLVETEGSPEVTNALVEALRLQWAYGHPFTPRDLPLLTHAFHEYPAGMQPATARHLLQTVLPGNFVLDPFVGGGTVLLEAMRAGRYAIGSDISPLALFVSRGRCWCPSSRVLDAFREASRSIQQASAACTAPVGNPSTLPRSGRSLSSGKDWDVIKGAIAEYLKAKGNESGSCSGFEGTAEGMHEGGAELDRSLWFAFSVARTRAAKARHRLAGSRNPLVAADYFAKVCQEYATAVEDLKQTVEQTGAPGSPRFPPLLVQKDARHWTPSFASQILAGKVARSFSSHGADVVAMMPAADHLGSRHSGRRSYAPGGIEKLPDDGRDTMPVSGTSMETCEAVVDVVLTSPPYPGVYDYLSHAREVRARLGHVPRWPSVAPTTASSPEEDKVSVEEEISFSSSPAAAVSGTHGHARDMPPVRATSVEEDADAVSESVDFLDSPLPVGRDWARSWTTGEIGAKTMVRRRLTDVSSGQSSVPSTDDSTQDSGAGARGTRGVSGVEMEWAKDQREWLGATAGLLKPGGGRMAVMLGDGGGVDTKRSLLRGVDDLQGTAEGLGQLRVVGWATLRAARGARRNMRTEHLVLLEKQRRTFTFVADSGS